MKLQFQPGPMVNNFKSNMMKDATGSSMWIQGKPLRTHIEGSKWTKEDSILQTDWVSKVWYTRKKILLTVSAEFSEVFVPCFLVGATEMSRNPPMTEIPGTGDSLDSTSPPSLFSYLIWEASKWCCRFSAMSFSGVITSSCFSRNWSLSCSLLSSCSLKYCILSGGLQTVILI